MAWNSGSKFFIKTDGNKVICSKVVEENPIRLPISVQFDENNSKLHANVFKDHDKIFDVLISDILLIQTTEKNVDKIFRAFEQLIESYDHLIKKMLPADLLAKLSNILSSTKCYVVDKMKSQNTATKRQKIIEKDESYVMPVKYGVGLN